MKRKQFPQKNKKIGPQQTSLVPKEAIFDQGNTDLKTLISLFIEIDVSLDRLDAKFGRLAGQIQNQNQLFRSVVHSQIFGPISGFKSIPAYYPNLGSPGIKFLESDKDLVSGPIY